MIIIVLLSVIITLLITIVVIVAKQSNKMKSLMMEKLRFDPKTGQTIIDTGEIMAEAQEGTSCAAVSDTDRQAEANQDSCRTLIVPNANAKVIAIADGIGSAKYSEVGSKFVTEKAIDLVKQALEEDVEHIDFHGLFASIQQSLVEMIKKDYADELDSFKPNSFGTTLILGIDLPDKFIAAYIGNGCLYHVSGFFTDFPNSICVPWNAVNLLTPHTIPENGREALYKLFCYQADSFRIAPTVLQITKEKETPGEMFIMTTDGVDSADHAIPVIDSKSNIYRPFSKKMFDLLGSLEDYVLGRHPINDDTLQMALEGYLTQIKEDKTMDDDTTVGVFISGFAKEYFYKKRRKLDENH